MFFKWNIIFYSIPGEILMKGRNIMMGYLEDLAKTNEAINQDGFLKSGDLGILQI